MADMEDEDEDGDTDSLMEWWYTVEQWDEVPSDEEEKAIQEDESKFGRQGYSRSSSLQQHLHRASREPLALYPHAPLHSRRHQRISQQSQNCQHHGGTTTVVEGVAAMLA
ncbi:uncharacterized protein KZ484_022114 [Pholidichthys leucotaenia]